MKALLDLLDHPGPVFVCVDARDPARPDRYVVPLRHLAARLPATEAELAQIPKVPGHDAVLDFYRRFNGVSCSPATPRTRTPGR